MSDASISADPIPAWLAALHALNANVRFQCDAVQKLTVSGELDDEVVVQSGKPVDVDVVAVLLNSLLASAVGHMSRLSEVE